MAAHEQIRVRETKPRPTQQEAVQKKGFPAPAAPSKLDSPLSPGGQPGGRQVRALPTGLLAQAPALLADTCTLHSCCPS